MSDEKKKEPTPSELLEQYEQAQRDELAAIRLAAAQSGAAGYTLPLVDPIMIGPAKATELKFRAPTVHDVRSTNAPEEFTAVLCDLTKEQVAQLSFDDWNAAQEVIEGLKERRAAGGRARSIKTT